MAGNQQMAESEIGNPIIQSQNRNDIISKLLASDEIQKLGKDIIIHQIKEASGVRAENKEAQKKPFGRFMYTVRDFWQGVWWTFPLLYLAVGVAILLIKILSKWAGV